jgi:hypothetical protein
MKGALSNFQGGKVKKHIAAIATAVLMLVGFAHSQQPKPISKEFSTAAIKYLAAIKWSVGSPLETAAHIQAEAAVVTPFEEDTIKQMSILSAFLGHSHKQDEVIHDCVADWRANLLKLDGTQPKSCEALQQ